MYGRPVHKETHEPSAQRTEHELQSLPVTEPRHRPWIYRTEATGLGCIIGSLVEHRVASEGCHYSHPAQESVNTQYFEYRTSEERDRGCNTVALFGDDDVLFIHADEYAAPDVVAREYLACRAIGLTASDLDELSRRLRSLVDPEYAVLVWQKPVFAVHLFSPVSFVSFLFPLLIYCPFVSLLLCIRAPLA